MVGVQSSKVRLWGGRFFYVLKSDDITCSGEVFRGDWTPDWTPCEDDIVLKKQANFILFQINT